MIMKIKEDEKKKKKKKKDELSVYLLMINQSTCLIQLKKDKDKTNLRKFIKRKLKTIAREEEETIPL